MVKVNERLVIPACAGMTKNGFCGFDDMPFRSGFLYGTLFLAVAAIPASTVGDVFLLKEAGKINGELLNPQEVPRRSYRICVSDGLELELEPKYVERVRKGEREAIAEYNAFAPFKEDTVENHLEIAEWCRRNQLPDLSRRHLDRVLEHDTDHAEARNLLGHFKGEDGQWTTRQEMLGSRGIKKHNGRWKTQQQIDVEQILERRKKSEVNWEKEVGSLRTAWIGSEEAKSKLISIDDPAAAVALYNALQSERNEDTRILLVKALANIGTSAALHEVARWAISSSEKVAEVRRVCFDELRKRPEALPAIIGFYISHLNAESGTFAINAAAYALGELDGHAAVPYLIDVLVTRHVEKKKLKAGGPTFSNDGSTGLGWGEKEVKVVNDVPNPRVLDALIRLTGANFQFNKIAWKTWLIESRRTPSFNARRG